ncbi:MAG: peptidoglycan D,D-transpeptidase FtsI family protein, partial [Luminiphilus sp.]
VLLLLLLATLVLGRLVLIQVVDEERGAAFLKHQGALRTVRTAEMPAYRGMLTDRRGEPLAISTPVVTLWADPRQLADSDRLAELASALGRSDDWLRRQLSLHEGKHFMFLRRNETPDRARRVLELKLPGVAGRRAYKRFYPAGEVTSQVIGLTDIDAKGIEGMERAYDAVLQGQSGQRRYIKDLHGEAVRDIGVVREAQPGRDIALTIDLRLQYLQHRELQRAIAETGAEAGAAVTIDARTGEILAMTSHPVFNPNSPSRQDGGARRNRVVTDTFEPGSTMKPLTLVAALETGQFTIDSIIDTSPGRIKVGRKVLPDPLNYGVITVSKVIEKSSQVGVTKIAQAIGHEPVLDVYRRFGLGQVSNIGFPGERAGTLPDRQRWSDIEKVTLAFGYGLTATPLQLAHAYSVFANRGEQIPLSLIRPEPG